MQQNPDALARFSERGLVAPAAFAEDFIRPESADPARPRPEHFLVTARKTTWAGEAFHELCRKIAYDLVRLNYTPRLGHYPPARTRYALNAKCVAIQHNLSAFPQAFLNLRRIHAFRIAAYRERHDDFSAVERT